MIGLCHGCNRSSICMSTYYIMLLSMWATEQVRKPAETSLEKLHSCNGCTRRGLWGKCLRCMAVRSCSHACQKLGWPAHRPLCAGALYIYMSSHFWHIPCGACSMLVPVYSQMQANACVQGLGGSHTSRPRCLD